MARAFARAGANVVLADISSESVERAADEVRRLGGSAVSVVTDVTSLESSNELADRAYGAFGRVDILCNNAGTSVLRRFADLTHDDWAKVFSVQLGGVINGVLAFLPRMLEQGGGGHVVNTSSMSGVGRGDLRTLNAPYVAAKFAVVGLSETMAPALAGEGIKVSVLCPGFTVADPNAVTNFAIPSAAWYEDKFANPRPGRRGDVTRNRGGAALYLPPSSRQSRGGGPARSADDRFRPSRTDSTATYAGQEPADELKP